MPMPGKDKDSPEDGSDRDRSLQADLRRLRSENASLMKENQRLSYEIYQVITVAQGLKAAPVAHHLMFQTQGSGGHNVITAPPLITFSSSV